MNLPTQDQVNAGARHAVSYAMGGISMLAALHLVTGGDADSAAKAVNLIGHGFSEIVAGGSALITVGMGTVAMLSANPLVQLLKGAFAVSKNPELAKDATVAQQATVATAVEAMPQVQVVVATPAVAQASPSPNVLSTTDAKVVNK